MGTRKNFTVPGGATFDTSTLYIDDPNNRVGIVTTSPAYTLDVAGIIRGSSGVIGLTTAGVPAVAIADGAFAIDTTNNTFYFRSGSQWRTITATIGADSVTLGTHTVGNYVASLVAGTGITVGAAGEGATPTITNTGVTSLTGTTNRITVSASTGAVTLNLPQDIATGSSPTFASLTLGGAGAQLSMNGSGSNMAIWNAAGTAAPAFTTRSAGTKVVLYPAIGASSVDYAIGIEASSMWFSVTDTSSKNFRWYAGTTNIATLTSAGTLTLIGDLAVNGADITTTATGTATVFNTNATTLNIGGAATTVSLGAATGTTTVNNSLAVTGNLTVNGTTTTVNSTTVTVDDPIITLGGDTAPASDDNKDRGVEFRYHTGSAAALGFFGYDDSTSKFTFLTGATNASEVFSGTKGTIDVGSVETLTLFVDSIEIDTTGATSGQVLKHNGTKFAPAADATESVSPFLLMGA